MAFALPLNNSPFTPAQRSWLNDFLNQTLGLDSSGAAIASRTAYDRRNPYAAPVLAVQRLTGADSAKDVRFVALDLRGSGLSYRAGDALGVYPENCPELVAAILETLNAAGDETVVTTGGRPMAARAALASACAVNTVNDSMLELLAASATVPDEARQLRALRDADGPAWPDDHDLLDLLQRFGSARPSIGALIGVLPPIQPRLYSISSSPAAYPEQVHLTVGVVRYHRHGCSRTRKGVASTFLAERVQKEQRVRIFVQPAHGFGLPEQRETPIIMVGPGTGIAPFRAFLQHRQATGARGRSWLFFGDQHQASDFLYRDELDTFLRSGALTYLDTAFSRDQAAKVYVQHRMLERAGRIWEWLERGAHVYVCGDARRMARDVDSALHRIVAETGGLGEAGAKQYVSGLVRAKRYQRDVY